MYIGLFLKISCLNGHRSFLKFEAKVMSIDKFWEHDFYMNTLFKFVRVLQVEDLLNARAFFYRMDSSRSQGGCSGYKGVEKTSFSNSGTRRCRKDIF